MKLEEIRNMSDEEFITYVNKFTCEQSELSYEGTAIEDKKVINFLSVINGLVFGLIPRTFSDIFTDNNLVLDATFIIGVIAGIPLTKKLFKKLYTESIKLKNSSNRQELINLKKDLENLSESELSFLVNINKSNHIYELHERISNVFDDDNYSSFIDTLEVTYKDDEEKLGYSKNITTNN